MEDIMDKLKESASYVDKLPEEFIDSGCAVVMAAHGDRCLGSIRGSYQMLTKLLAYCIVSDPDFGRAIEDALDACKKVKMKTPSIAALSSKKKNRHVC